MHTDMRHDCGTDRYDAIIFQVVSLETNRERREDALAGQRFKVEDINENTSIRHARVRFSFVTVSQRTATSRNDDRVG